MSKLRDVLILLIDGDPLPPRVKDRPLTGEWRGYRDLHIEPDWLLLYKIDGNNLILVRTGSHADLLEGRRRGRVGVSYSTLSSGTRADTYESRIEGNCTQDSWR